MSLAELMGALIFVAGLVMVVVSAVAIVVPVGTVGDLQRTLLFVAGVLTLTLGYGMVRAARSPGNHL